MVVGVVGSRLRKTAGVEPWLEWIAELVPELEAFNQASADVTAEEVGFVILYVPIRQ